MSDRQIYNKAITITAVLLIAAVAYIKISQ